MQPICRNMYHVQPTLVKGKAHTIIALHEQGASVQAIAQATGSSKSTVARYTNLFDLARSSAVIGNFFGMALSPAAFCQVAGCVARATGTSRRIVSNR